MHYYHSRRVGTRPPRSLDTDAVKIYIIYSYTLPVCLWAAYYLQLYVYVLHSKRAYNIILSNVTCRYLCIDILIAITSVQNINSAATGAFKKNITNKNIIYLGMSFYCNARAHNSSTFFRKFGNYRRNTVRQYYNNI